MNLDQQKPGEKSGKRKQKHSKKKEQKGRKSEQALVTEELTDAAMASGEVAESEASVAATEATATEVEQATAAVAPAEDVAVKAPPAGRAPAEPVARVASFRERMASIGPRTDTVQGKPSVPADTAQAVPAPVAVPITGVQAIANAYRDYTRKSLEDAQSFAEKLSAARSLDKAVEVQAEYAQKACENFAADSRKIRELHRELFWQAFRLPSWPLGKNR